MRAENSAQIFRVDSVRPMNIAPFDAHYFGPPTSIIETAGSQRLLEAHSGGQTVHMNVQVSGRANFPVGSRVVKVTTEQNPALGLPVLHDPVEQMIVAVPEHGATRYFSLIELAALSNTRPLMRESSALPGQMLPLPNWLSTLPIPERAKIVPGHQGGENEIELAIGDGRIVRVTLVQDTAVPTIDPAVLVQLHRQLVDVAPRGSPFLLEDITSRMNEVQRATDVHASLSTLTMSRIFKCVQGIYRLGGTSVRQISVETWGGVNDRPVREAFTEVEILPGATISVQSHRRTIVITMEDEIIEFTPPEGQADVNDPALRVILLTPRWLGYQALLADAK